jgi:hypothetical protein
MATQFLRFFFFFAVHCLFHLNSSLSVDPAAPKLISEITPYSLLSPYLSSSRSGSRVHVTFCDIDPVPHAITTCSTNIGRNKCLLHPPLKRRHISQLADGNTASPR